MNIKHITGHVEKLMADWILMWDFNICVKSVLYCHFQMNDTHLQKFGLLKVTVGRDSIPVRRPDSQSREPGFKSHCGRFEPLASVITPRCHSSLSCINEYLAIQSGGYVNEEPSRSNSSVAEYFPKKLRWPWNEQVCQGVKCKAL